MNKVSLSIGVFLTLISLQAAEVNASSSLFDGVVSGKLKTKTMYILGDKTNSFAPEEGSGYIEICYS